MEQQIKTPRIPDPAGAIQVNFCKNPSCKNFGLPAGREKQPRGPGSESRGRDAYTIVGGKETDTMMLKCTLCGEFPTVKSNLAINEELSRMSAYLTPIQPITCPNASCSNHIIGISTSGAYYSFGKTKSGSQRYQCKQCRKTFAVGMATTGQKKPHKNALVFRLLMNKMPFKRICETAGINIWTLYWKIDFLHKQCLAFAAHREQALLDGMPMKRLYLGMDRQDYMVNWSNAADKRNVILHSVGCADNETGYVFGLHLNYDSAVDSAVIEKEAETIGDYSVRVPFRRHARVWLQKDYEEAVKEGVRRRRTETNGTLTEDIALSYEEASQREDVEISEGQTLATRLPVKGMQVHAEYTLYAHFFFLRSLFGVVEKLRFFIDQDSGMLAACLGAFAEEIRQQRCAAFYVKINKKLNINEKRRIMAGVRKKWANQKKQHPDLSDAKLKLFLIKEGMKEVMHLGKWQDKWIYHPFPNMSEPEKAVCYLTDIQGYDEDHLAWLYNKASLHAVDRFFMQIRRRISLLERPIATSSNTGRKWYGYNAYNPGVIAKVLDIFRVFYDYIEVGNDDKTPAMRLGLAKSKIDMEDIIYYT